MWIGSLGRRRTFARRRRRSGIIERISSSRPKHSSRSSASSGSCRRGLGITVVPGAASAPGCRARRGRTRRASCRRCRRRRARASSATPYPVDTVSRWRTSISGKATWLAMWSTIAPATSSSVARLDPLEPGRGVDLHHERPVVALEHVDAGDPQAHDLGRAHRRPLVLRRQLDGLDRAAAVHVGAELVALRDPPHRRHDAVADDERADVAALALLDEAAGSGRSAACCAASR